MLTRHVFACALSAALLALTACGGHSASVADPPIPTSTPSVTASPKPHRETPEAFIRRWAAEEKRMENTGETTTYLTMSKGCKACRALAKNVQRYYAAGGFVKWGGWQVLSIKEAARSGPTASFVVRNRSLPTVYRESASGPTQHLTGGVTTELLQLRRRGESFTLQAKGELAS